MVSVSSPQGRFAESAAQLDETRMIEGTAHGKHHSASSTVIGFCTYIWASLEASS